MQLYKISESLNDLSQAYENGDIPDEAYADTLQGIEMEFEQKAEQIAKIIRNFEGNNLALKSEIDRLKAMQTCNNNQIEYCKKYLFEQMKITGKTMFATELFKFSIQKNGGMLPLQILNDYIPPEYRKNEADNAFVRNAINSGEQLDFAKLGERGESLRIK